MWNFLWRNLITSYPLVDWFLHMCLRITMSIKFSIILLLKAWAVLYSKFDTGSKCIYLLEYNPMCL